MKYNIWDRVLVKYFWNLERVFVSSRMDVDRWRSIYLFQWLSDPVLENFVYSDIDDYMKKEKKNIQDQYHKSITEMERNIKVYNMSRSNE